MAAQALPKSVEVESIPMLQKKFEDSVMNYKVSKQKALELIQCLGNLNPDEILEESNIQSQLTEIAYKEILKKDFDAMNAKAAELRNALEVRGDYDKAVKEKMKFEWLEERTIRLFSRRILVALEFRDQYNIEWPAPREFATFNENIVNIKDNNVEKPDEVDMKEENSVQDTKLST